MKFKKYRVKKEHIYENASIINNSQKLLKAAFEKGYTFVKVQNAYWMVSIKRYVRQPDQLHCEVVEIEIVEDECICSEKDCENCKQEFSSNL